MLFGRRNRREPVRRGDSSAPARSPRDAALVLAVDVLALGSTLVVTRPSEIVGFVYPLAVLVVLGLTGDYRYRLDRSALEEVPRLVARLAVVAVPLALIAGSSSYDVLREAGWSAGLLFLGRCIAYAGIRARRRRRPGVATVVLGAGPVGQKVLDILEDHPEYGLRPIGIVDDAPMEEGSPLLGRLADLETLRSRHAIGCLVVAFGPARSAALLSVLRDASADGMEIFVVPRFFELGVHYRGLATEDLWGVPLVRLRPAAERAAAWPMKRATDIIVSGFMLAVTLPLMAASAVLVRISSPGPILFRQLRVGRQGQLVPILKFRTLPVDHVDQSWNASPGEYTTRIGRFLRRTCLDEIPQFWNVLRGDMSLVGPRPERGYLVEQFNETVDGYRDRHRLPVGLTGWAQVHGLRGETSLGDRARFDNQYIERWSFWRDIVILVRTTTAVLRTGPPSSRGRGDGLAIDTGETTVDEWSPHADSAERGTNRASTA